MVIFQVRQLAITLMSVALYAATPFFTWLVKTSHVHGGWSLIYLTGLSIVMICLEILMGRLHWFMRLMVGFTLVNFYYYVFGQVVCNFCSWNEINQIGGALLSFSWIVILMQEAIVWVSATKR